jgi:hypothetical protein
LRQGLLFYAQQTLAGLAAAAESELAGALDELMNRVPPAVEASLAASGTPCAGRE